MTEAMMNALKNWRDLNDVLTTFTEDEMAEMLEYELNHENRKTFVERLHQRFTTLRMTREREIIMDQHKGV